MSNVFWNPQRPLGDFVVEKVLRQISWWRSWKKDLKNSGLPSEVQSLIHNVVQPSRMMRFEKAEVTDDLIAHFEDGNRRGKTYSELTADFGDPHTISELIESSKTRSRPVLVKMFRAGIAGGLGVVGLYVAMLTFFHSQSPSPSIDFLTDFNANVVETPEELRAWPIYRESWTRHEFCEGPGGRFAEMMHPYGDDNPSNDPTRLVRPTDPSWEIAVKKLDDSQDLIQAFRKGARLPYLGVSLEVNPNDYNEADFAALFPGREFGEDYDNSMGMLGMGEDADKLLSHSLVSILLPHVQSFRKAARIFYVDTRRAILENDSDRVVDNIEVTFGIAHQVSESSCLVNGLVAMAISSIGFQQIEEVLREHPGFLNAEQLNKIKKSVDDANPANFIAFDGERIFVKDMIQRIYSDDGNGDGRMTPEGLDILNAMVSWGGTLMSEDGNENWFPRVMSARKIFGPMTLFVSATRKEITEKADSMYDQVELNFDAPYWLNLLDGIDDELQEEPIKYSTLASLFPAVQQIKQTTTRNLAIQQATSLAITLHLYHQEYGEWPNSIDEVGAEWIEELPADQLTGKTVQVRFTESGPIIYGVGPDLDDDGGKPILNEVSETDLPFGPVETAKDGDWVMWPMKFLD